MTSASERAMEILSLDVLPDDARARIDALYREASEPEKYRFNMIYEGLALREFEIEDLAE